MNGSTKHVFTSTAPTGQWANSVFVADPAPEYVAELQGRSGGDIGVHGSIRLAQSLLRAGLVDELRLVVSPVLAHNGGRKLFDGEGELRRLDLLESRTSPAGTLFLTYATAA